MYHKFSRGFTVVELMIAMAFLSFILLFCALATVQMIRTYNKGTTIKQINQVGRIVTEDLSRQIRQTPADDIILNQDMNRICVGNVMYLWTPLYAADGSNNLSPNTSTANRLGGLTARFVRQALNSSQLSLCQSGNSNLTANANNYDLLNRGARVLYADVEPIQGGRLSQLTFYITTYDSSEQSDITAGGSSLDDVFTSAYIRNAYTGASPRATAASFSPTCNTSLFGNFCYVTSFSTIVYTSN